MKKVEKSLVVQKKKVEKVAGVTGLEPAASGVTGQRSNQLSYTPVRIRTPCRS